jgi:hypothetical protein
VQPMPGNTTLRTSTVEASWTDARQPLRAMPRIHFTLTAICVMLGSAGTSAFADYVLDSFLTPQTGVVTVGEGHYGERLTSAYVNPNNQIGVSQCSVTIDGSGTARIQLAAQSSGTATASITYLIPIDFPMAEVTGINITGSGVVSASGASPGGASSVVRYGYRLQSVYPPPLAFYSRENSVREATMALGDLSFSLSNDWQGPFGPTAVNSLTIYFEIHAFVGLASTDYQIDEITLTSIAVPTPAAAPLLALAGLLGNRRRRS